MKNRRVRTIKKKRVKPGEIPLSGEEHALERDCKKEIVKKLVDEGWFSVPIPGSLYLRGFPDLFCYHPVHGMRLIEVKRSGRSDPLERTQLIMFRKMARYDCGVWVLTNAREYYLLFESPNWGHYIKT